MVEWSVVRRACVRLLARLAYNLSRPREWVQQHACNGNAMPQPSSSTTAMSRSHVDPRVIVVNEKDLCHGWPCCVYLCAENCEGERSHRRDKLARLGAGGSHDSQTPFPSPSVSSPPLPHHTVDSYSSQAAASLRSLARHAHRSPPSSLISLDAPFEHARRWHESRPYSRPLTGSRDHQRCRQQQRQ